jgi:hypothetical protein
MKIKRTLIISNLHTQESGICPRINAMKLEKRSSRETDTKEMKRRCKFFGKEKKRYFEKG